MNNSNKFSKKNEKKKNILVYKQNKNISTYEQAVNSNCFNDSSFGFRKTKQNKTILNHMPNNIEEMTIDSLFDEKINNSDNLHNNNYASRRHRKIDRALSHANTNIESNDKLLNNDSSLPMDRDPADVMLSTSDNPFNPFVDFDSWFAFDSSMNYNSCSLLARIAKVSDDLPDNLNAIEIAKAIDTIVTLNIQGNYIRVFRDNDSDVQK